MAAIPPNNGYLDWALIKIKENIIENPKVIVPLIPTCLYTATRFGTSYHAIPFVSLLSATALCTVQTYNIYKNRQYSKVVLEENNPQQPEEAPTTETLDDLVALDVTPAEEKTPEVVEIVDEEKSSTTGTSNTPIEIEDDPEPAKEANESDLAVDPRNDPMNVFQGGGSAKNLKIQQQPTPKKPLIEHSDKKNVSTTPLVEPAKEPKKLEAEPVETQGNSGNIFQRGYQKKKRSSRKSSEKPPVNQTKAVIVHKTLEERLQGAFQNPK